jgi:hypothetical protein
MTLSSSFQTVRRRLARTAVAAITLSVALAFAAPRGAAAANDVADWNVIGIDAAVAGGQNPIHVSRTIAMMHLAMHDALNAVDRRYEPYLYFGPIDRSADAGVAVAAAARDVLVAVIPDWGTPDQRAKALPMVEAAYVAALARFPEGPAKAAGIVVGQGAAASMIAARKADGSPVAIKYTPGTEPGLWRPHPNPSPANPPIADPSLAAGNWPAILPQWAHVTPFTMATPWQFRLPGPPALASAEYARDYNEVKKVGGKSSTERTAEQTEIARFWYESSPEGWSRIAREVAAERGVDPWGVARLLALVNATIADGYVAGADTRYHYNFWRPVTAIRAGETDGNDATGADPTWESYLNTPPLPDYPSTHSVAGGAAAAVLAQFFGGDQVTFKMQCGPPFAGVTRSFNSFSQAAQENGDSRVYAGIHFRSAVQDGIKQGDQIGRRAFDLFLQTHKLAVR